MAQDLGPEAGPPTTASAADGTRRHGGSVREDVIAFRSSSKLCVRRDVKLLCAQLWAYLVLVAGLS